MLALDFSEKSKVVTPEPEPPGDIRAQLAAVLDPNHPKRAAFLVPEDAANLRIPDDGIAGLHVVRREEGVIVTTDRMLAELFEQRADDATMALILGYPESKDKLVERCRKPVHKHARAVQARDKDGHVVTECFCSPLMFLRTCEVIARHVPRDGELLIMSPIAAIARRIAMRRVGF